MTFTVTASQAVTEATAVTFQVIPGDGTAANQGTTKTNANDFGSGALNLMTGTIPANGTSVTFDVSSIADLFVELTETYSVEVKIGSETFTKTINVLDGAVGAGQVFTLTSNIDTMPGLIGSLGSSNTDGDDSINGVVGVETTMGGNLITGPTLSKLDVINGGAGTNVLTIKDQNDSWGDYDNNPATTNTQKLGGTKIAGINTTNIQAVNVSSVGELIVDTTDGFAGVTALNVTASGTGEDATITAAATTDVTVSGVKGAIDLSGGKSVTVTDATANKAICRVPCDHIPIRSWPLIRARDVPESVPVKLRAILSSQIA